ncbi:uncharacterized protein VTP21DRAFT_798 [Calcarisporiella thermophila]|uniref:uncharacterized protein n=1 Tax=Calcarisporiella thermophila TaxID=911321 RepID=UPI003742812B
MASEKIREPASHENFSVDPKIRSASARNKNLQEWMLATFQISLSDWLLIGTFIFGGCCSNVYALEILVSSAPKSGHLITFAQFLFVAIDGLISHLHFSPSSQVPIPRLRPTKVPLWRWFVQVIMFFSVSVLNNWALAFDIGVPLHIVFRSGGLIVSMLLGYVVAGKRYTTKQIVAVSFITAGIFMATLSSASSHTKHSESHTNVSDFVVGVTLLTIALVISALMGLFQEQTYKQYGKQWREGLFYSHFLSLPFFLIFYKDILSQFRLTGRSPQVSFAQMLEQIPALSQLLPSSVKATLSSFGLPKLWIYLLVNVLTQYVCISGVHRLTAFASALTLNLVLNLRKFTSLVLSVLLFNNEFSFATAFGTALVFLGTFLYTWAGASRANAPAVNAEKKES